MCGVRLKISRSLLLAFALIAGVVIVASFFRAFSSPIVVVALVVLYVAVSIRNKRKFSKKAAEKPKKP